MSDTNTNATGRRRLVAAAALLAVGLLTAACVFGAYDPLSTRAAPQPLPAAGETLTILDWNVGYAGLGADSDFIADGGSRWRAPSKAAVDANLAAIATLLETVPADLVLLQETARASPLNYGRDVVARLDAALPTAARTFYADVRTPLLPPPARLIHGASAYSRVAVAETRITPLPLEEGALVPGVKRQYALLETVIPFCDGEWVVANVHLSAFDAAGETRLRQLDAVLEHAAALYEAGAHVILGGDWNMVLAETDFPSTTGEEHLFWLVDFPEDRLPEGWRIAVDPTAPTVRTNERPYQRGENHRTVIDGFFVSPNVEIEAVAGFDLDFQHTDHHPVRGQFRARASRCG